jgi:hypothetical protein
MKIQRTAVLAGFLMGAAAGTALGDNNMVIDTGGQMRIQLSVPTDDDVDQTTPVTAGRLEIARVGNLPPWGATFSLNHMSLGFADFAISRAPFGTTHFRSVGVHLRGAVSFAAFEAPAGVFTFFIPREAVTVYGAAMVDGFLGDLHAGEEQPAADVTGRMDLNTNTFQAQVVFHKQKELLHLVTVGGPLTVNLSGTIRQTAAPVPGDFRITCTPTLYLQQGNTGTCTVHSEDGFDRAVQLNCSGLAPLGGSCQFDPPTVTPPAGGAVTSTMRVSTGPIAPGTYQFQPYAYRGGVVRSTTVQLILSAGDLFAAYDATLQAPSCGSSIGRSCDSNFLAASRGSLREAHAPNTIAGSCGEWRGSIRFPPGNAVHSIKVSTTDGAPLERDRQVRIDATVGMLQAPWEHAVDFFYADDATNPTWILIGTVVPDDVDSPTYSVTHVLPRFGGPRQAVRVQIREGGTAVPCSPVSESDRDDLIFAVSALPIS